jgi:glucokinase
MLPLPPSETAVVGPGVAVKANGGPQEVILAFDVGGTKIAAALGTGSGAILEEVIEPSPAGGEFAAMWEVICALGDRLISGALTPAAIGVSIGGPLDADAGVIYAPPNLPGWGSVPLRRLLEERFGLPSYIQHDAKAGALAEWLFGAGKGCQNLVFLTFGTGLGAGLIVDGRLPRGRANIGEVGHWRMASEGPTAYGKVGAWEAFSSGAGLPRLAHWRYPGRWPADMGAKTLVNLARDGDAAAGAIIDEAATVLGRGISYLVDLLSPEIVVLGSLAVRAGDLFLPTVQNIVDTECLTSNLPCPVVAAALGERIGATAALCAAIYQRRELPK